MENDDSYMENNRLNGTISSTETVDRYMNRTKDYLEYTVITVSFVL